jgi:hypothetical protein
MSKEKEIAFGMDEEKFKKEAELLLVPLVMKQWVVYYNPSDYPEKYVVREWHVLRDSLIANDHVVIGNTLEEARTLIPQGLYRLPRLENDDPVIVEVWI